MEHRIYIENLQKRFNNSTQTNCICEKEYIEIESKLTQYFIETEDPECIWILGELNLLRIQALKNKGISIGENGLNHDFNHQGINNTILETALSKCGDFYKKSHNTLIMAYKNLLERYPNSVQGRLTLVQLLIDNYRFQEASEQVELAIPFAGQKEIDFKILLGEIEFKSGRRASAEKIWNDIIVANGKKPDGYLLVGNKYADFGMFDIAAEHFKMSFELQNFPRDIKPLLNLLEINYINCDYREGIRTLNMILEVLSSDHGIHNGIEIDSYLEKKSTLEDIIRNQI